MVAPDPHMPERTCQEVVVFIVEQKAGCYSGRQLLHHFTSQAIVDGYVWLDDAGKPGLGAHLYQALGGRVAVLGVAETKFRGAETPTFSRTWDAERGQRRAPLEMLPLKTKKGATPWKGVAPLETK
jgi:hypothetical protein